MNHVELIPATCQQQSILENLLELYIHDFSDFIAVDLAPDGRFGYPQLEDLWTEPGHYPFLIQVDGHLAGFVFVQQGSEITGDPDIWDMDEFFIVRRYRRRGIGIEAAHRIWYLFPGRWEVRVMEANRPACAFWEGAVSAWSQGVIREHIEHDGVSRLLFRLQS